ncbi:hypothetical protein [Zoogloea sp. LCSB751]|uniref:hypothetical protein n=1 Tax=Zoogloea sp. LCSB751 TaxID=1965277 RepID=UPI001116D781|nr:hypothetical protein [Zoogloea sp. LCSB751]
MIIKLTRAVPLVIGCVGITFVPTNSVPLHNVAEFSCEAYCAESYASHHSLVMARGYTAGSLMAALSHSH